ncbi:MAG: sigma-70 family RNA polymerase sigma factor [Candidatus Sumerlaeia bacterium]|nr:sigma-70 family RNA polymerase sigma factor [Candidatus Sumerlaeia bacterium]
MPVSEDHELMQRLQGGDEAALERLVRRWEQPILNFFYHAIGDLDTAEDLRQDVFVRLYTYRAGYRGNGTFRSWLYQLAANVLRSHLRRVRSLPMTGFSETDNVPDGEAEGDADRSRGGRQLANESAACREVFQMESQRLARALLDSLPVEDREVLLLRFYEGLQYAEISAVLGIAESSAKSRVYRALEKLRQRAAARGLKAEDVV